MLTATAPKTATKDSTSSYSSGSGSSTNTGRQTRKAAAQELASKQRITRNRQPSGGAAARSETPPLSRIRRPQAVKMPQPMIEPAPKRKRSHEDSNNSQYSAEPGPKYIKIEIKEEIADTCSLADEDQSSTISEQEGLKIKQEIEEPYEEMSVDAAAIAVEPSTKAAATKGRWAGRKSSANDLKVASGSSQTSPTTRATRQTKLSSPSPSGSQAASEPKRRRVAGNSLTRNSSSQNLLKTTANCSTPSAQDEDSKDSLCLSDDIVLSLIKQEKQSADLIFDNEEANDKVEDKAIDAESNGGIEPLSVQTESKEKLSNEKTANDKAASLSPEMISEGVSEISVKQFYKKPEFMENNLGIEQDPKLGEIVQKVSTSSATSTTEKLSTKQQTSSPTSETANAVEDAEDKNLDDSYSSESLKEGDLHFEESSDEQKKTPCSELLLEEEQKDGKLKQKPKEKEIAALEAKTATDSCGKIRLLEQIEFGAIDVEDDNVDEEEDAEESETISMDNNASLHEEAMEEELNEEVSEDLAIEAAEVEEDIDESTNEAPIIDDIELLTTHDDDEEITSLQEAELLDEASEEKLLNETENKDKLELVVKELIDNDNKASLDEKPADLLPPTKTLATDEVLAKIDAELKKIGEKLKEKPLTEAAAAAADSPSALVEENKENLVLLQPPEAADIKLDDIKLLDSLEISADVCDAATTSKTEKSEQKLEADKKSSVVTVAVVVPAATSIVQDCKKSKKFIKDVDYMEILPGESEDVIKAKQQLKELDLLTCKRDKRVRPTIIESGFEEAFLSV